MVLPGGLPLEECLFFLAVPVAAILTFEAVRARRPGWRFGDEPAAGSGPRGEDPEQSGPAASEPVQ